MNERIRELWWKARIGYNNQSCDNEVVEKFAELLVKECADICTARKLTPAEFVASELREYFGVER